MGENLGAADDEDFLVATEADGLVEVVSNFGAVGCVVGASSQDDVLAIW